MFYCCLLATRSSQPEFRVKSKAEAASDTPCSPLPLEGAGFGNKGFHQRTHLAALMIPEEDNGNMLDLQNELKIFRRLLSEYSLDKIKDNKNYIYS